MIIIMALPKEEKGTLSLGVQRCKGVVVGAVDRAGLDDAGAGAGLGLNWEKSRKRRRRCCNTYRPTKARGKSRGNGVVAIISI